MDLMKLTREQAVELAGIDYVLEAEKDNCEFTSRLTNGTEWDGYDEFAGVSSVIESGDFEGCRVRAIYFQPVELTKNCEDLGSLDWEVSHYQIN